jgi:hypothetical protein
MYFQDARLGCQVGFLPLRHGRWSIGIFGCGLICRGVGFWDWIGMPMIGVGGLRCLRFHGIIMSEKGCVSVAPDGIITVVMVVSMLLKMMCYFRNKSREGWASSASISAAVFSVPDFISFPTALP